MDQRNRIDREIFLHPLHICYSGDAEPLLQGEEGCFGVRDQTGRIWFGRETERVPDLVEFARIGNDSQMWVGRVEDEEDLLAKLSESFQ